MYRDPNPPARPTHSAPVRARTYLAPGIPTEFFEILVSYLGESLGREVRLECDTRSSGPMHGDADPFGAGVADIGFLCAPSYLYLLSMQRPSVHLVPAGFVFQDSRHTGEPVYYSDVVVRTEDHAQQFEDLRNRIWGFNDECSLSGHFAAQQHLAEISCGDEFFNQRIRTGSHRASLRALLSSQVDAASIDSTVLAAALREQPALGSQLRILDSWGPFPIQPVVTRASLGLSWANQVGDALLRVHSSERYARLLSAFRFERCVGIDDAAYAEERRCLLSIGALPTGVDGQSQD